MNPPSNNAAFPAQSCDTLFNGELICYQHRHGYRFSIDAVLLAHFVHVTEGDRILDLGTGCGIVSLILLYRHYHVLQEVCGVEIQQGLALLAEKNMRTNGFSAKATIIHGDLKQPSNSIRPEFYSRVIFNPPFYCSRSGRVNVLEEPRLARHQILAGLNDFLAAAAAAVKNRGTVYCIYPAEKLCEFISCAVQCRLEVKKIQFIYSYPKTDESARLVLLQCLKNGGPGTEILPPFFIYKEKNGDFTSEMQGCYRENGE